MENKRSGLGVAPRAIVELPRAELAQLQALLRANQLPDEDCADPTLYFCAIFDGDELIATGGLESAASCALLRSIVVRPDYRALGLARRITDHLLARAADEERLEIYLLTETAEKYFAVLGFQPVERSEVPAGVARTRQFSTLCPQSACCMRIVLSPGQTQPG
jgi:amino-acid N-acetyltransferase